MSGDDEPLDDDLKALLALERRRPPAPAGARDAVSRGLAAALAAPRAPAGTRGAGASGSPAWIRGGKLVLTLAVGAGLGASLHAALSPRSTVVVEAPRAALPASPAPPTNTTAPLEAPSPPVTASAAPAPAPRPGLARSVPTPTATSAPDAGAAAPPLSSADEMRQERQLLEVARAALARRDAASALDALARHAGSFPNGTLTEEREAMVIQALVSAGRTAEAAARAASFHQRYPNSLFWSGIQAASSGR